MSPGGHGSAARRGRARRRARALLFAVFLAALVAAPAIPASAGPLNPFSGLCGGSTPSPAAAGSGVDGLVGPPGQGPPRTTYDNYGTAGLHWNSADLGCGDLFARAGNAVADTLFTFVRALDRVTITTYQAAYSSHLLDGLASQVANVIHALSHTLYLPYLTPFVIIGAIWLAWKGLLRGRATASVEATVWMVIAITAALWLVNRPHQWMSAGTTVVDTVSQTTMRSIIGLGQPGRGECFKGAARVPPARQQSVAVDCAANTLWRVLAYEPWQAGEFGSNERLTARKSLPLLHAQTITRKELRGGDARKQVERKRQRWERIKEDLKSNHPDVYPLFQGKRWKERFGIAFGALLAALFCGLLILVASAAVLVFKIAFLLLLMAGPLFLLAGVHPGVGRLMATHWFETLVGMLIKQMLVSVALSFIMLGYMVILAPSSPFPWGVQIMLVALVAIAALVLWPAFRRILMVRSVATEGVTEEARGPGLGWRRTRGDEEAASAGRLVGSAMFPGRRTVTVTRALRRGARVVGSRRLGAAALGGVANTAANGSGTPRSRRAAGQRWTAPGDGTSTAADGGDGTNEETRHGGTTPHAPIGTRGRRTSPVAAPPLPAPVRAGERSAHGSAASPRSWRDAPRPRRTSASPVATSSTPRSGAAPWWPGRRPGTPPPLPFWLRPSPADDQERS